MIAGSGTSAYIGAGDPPTVMFREAMRYPHELVGNGQTRKQGMNCPAKKLADGALHDAFLMPKFVCISILISPIRLSTPLFENEISPMVPDCV